MRRLLALGLLSACTDYNFHGSKATEPPGTPEDSALPDPPPTDTAPPEPVDTGEPPPPPTCDGYDPPVAPVIEVNEACLREPEVGTLDPVIEWSFRDDIGYAADPDRSHTYIMPAVGQLTDDNGDGRIDANDIPDIAYSVYNDSYEGGLRVASGDGSVEHLYIRGVSWGGIDWPITHRSGIAIGDLEGDGIPEIVTVVLASDGDARVAAIRPDGTAKWVEPTAITSVFSYPSLADLDGDGASEVVVGHIIVDTDGTLLAEGTGGTGAPDDHPNPDWGSISIPVDLDLDGTVEIVAGNTIYDASGTILAQSGEADGFTAVADLDLDGVAEIVTTIHSQGVVYAWEADGTLLWRTATGSGGGGSPTIADFDADGEPEIGVAGKYAYVMLETDGTVVWSSTIKDNSSYSTGSSVYDFDGDGAFEVVFADEDRFIVFDGATGAVLYENYDHAHGTAWEYPVVADADGDGEVEIVVGSTSNTGEWDGITVLGSATGSWTPARTVWNQHAYSITNVEADGSIPTHPAANWATWNTFRAAGPERGPATWFSDLQVPGAEICDLTCPLDVVTLWFSVGNAGLLDEAGIAVELVDEAGGVVYAETLSTVASGEGQILGPVELDKATWGRGSLTARIDPSGQATECDATNNTLSLGGWPCPDEDAAE